MNTGSVLYECEADIVGVCMYTSMSIRAPYRQNFDEDSDSTQ